MTSTKMLVAVALLVVAAMVVAPAAARGTDISDIESDDTIFMWEKGLDLTGLMANISSLRKLDGTPTDGTVLVSLPVANASSFNVPTYLEDDDLGTYYAYDGSDYGDSVIIDKPKLGLDVVLETDTASSVDGKSVSEDTNVEFKIKTYKVGDTYFNSSDGQLATVTVKVKPEGGASFTTFGGQNLAGIPVDASTVYTLPINLNDEETGSYTAIVEWTSPQGWADSAADSNTVSFTIRTKEVTIEADKDTVVRGNPFTVTVSGDSKVKYYVYVKDESIDADKYPYIRSGQTSVNITSAALSEIMGEVDDDAGILGTEAIITTDAAGSRKIQFDTNTSTDDRTFTIKVISTDGKDDDTVKVTIEKGAITVVAEGDQSYFLGEEVTFSGTNTDSSKVYLFITGPNLASSGTWLGNPSKTGVSVANPDLWDTAENASYATVDSNDEWELDWDTSLVDLDAGTYTIYAVSEPANKDMLSDVEYDSVSVVIKKPFVTAGKTADVVAKGDELTITGTAEGDPNNVVIWVLGKNYVEIISATVEDDGTFEEDVDATNLASGQYFVVVQHPMYNGAFDVTPQEDNRYVYDEIAEDILFYLTGRDSLQGSDAAQALTEALDNPYIDDTYTKLDFLVEEPWITIDSIGDKYVGDVFTLTGETNLAEGDELLVEVVSASFKPTEKTASGEFSGASGTTEVVAGEDYNAWSFEVDASAFKPDEYIVRVESVDADYTATTTFDVLAGAPPTTAPATTAPPTTAPATTAPPATAEPTPTPTPGFGALIALIGLGAVAVLVVRKH
jgi:PGF-CTERM protein